jgi:hypothetical protein
LHKHSVSIDGKNYGFAFDDQQGHASDIGVGSFNSARIVLESWSDDTSTAPPSPSPSTISIRDLLASYLTSESSEEASELAMSLALNADSTPHAAPQSLVDQVLASSASDVDFSGFLNGDQNDSDDDDSGVMPTIALSARHFTASRLAG